MKLKSVKILGNNFRSLAANKLYEFNVSQRDNRLSTKIFAGLNGSGKSNFLELLAEIFYFLETCNFDKITKSERESKALGFEIEYLLPKTINEIEEIFEEELKKEIDTFITNRRVLLQISKEEFEKQYSKEIEEFSKSELDKLPRQLLKDNFVHVRIEKKLGYEPEYSIRSVDDSKGSRTVKNKIGIILPTKIVAYTSGQNELLSNPFFKIRYHYFNKLETKNSPKEKNEKKNERLFFIDNRSNFSIFISNMLLAETEKLEYLKQIFKVEDLHSFRITINLVDYKKEKISLSERVQINIEKLKNCATSWIQRNEKKEEFLILDYRVNDATHNAFRFHFKSSFELFQVFYELENLNLHLVHKDTRKLILNAHKSLNLSDEIPAPDPSRLIFRIEKISLYKIVEEGKPAKQVYYKGLSDGEHQFNEVIGSVMMMEQDGCLFLLDEPDTHFNPMWRAKMIKMLNHVTAYSYDPNGQPESVRQQEIIITSHSPFVISDSYKEDVYKFDKGEFENPELQTYGSSVGLILETIFDRDISISDFSNEDLNLLKASIKTLADIQKVKKELFKFGEAIEKFDVYIFLQTKEEELKNLEKKK